MSVRLLRMHYRRRQSASPPLLSQCCYVVTHRRRGVLCINIGDGATPRTAALAAYLTAWTAVSVDPAMRPEWEGKHPQGIGRLWSYGAKFEEWAAEPSGAMSEVGAECVETSTLQEGGQQQDEMEDQPEVAAEGEASRAAAAAKEAADAEAKASIAYIKASPAVRNAWISWLEAQAESSAANQTEATQSEPSGLAAAASAGTARGAVGLAAIGFDPALHTQETRAAFCAEHQRGTRAPGTVAEHAAATLPVVVEGVAHLVLICVHAHNRFTGVAAMERIRGHYGFPPTVLVSLPCCHQFNPTNDLGERSYTHLLAKRHYTSGHELHSSASPSVSYNTILSVSRLLVTSSAVRGTTGRLPDEDFEDLAIFSACRRVLVWRWARGPAPQQPFPPIVAGNSGPSPGSNRASGKRARRPPAEEDGTGAGLDFAQADA